MRVTGELTCREIVELVTEYLEGALDEETRSRFEEHIVLCPHCLAYLDQMRETVRATRGLAEPAPLDPELERELLAAFRGWRRDDAR